MFQLRMLFCKDFRSAYRRKIGPFCVQVGWKALQRAGLLHRFTTKRRYFSHILPLLSPFFFQMAPELVVGNISTLKLNEGRLARSGSRMVDYAHGVLLLSRDVLLQLPFAVDVVLVLVLSTIGSAYELFDTSLTGKGP